MDFLYSLFDTSDYSPRWKCGNFSPFVGWLHIVSDLLIFAAYFAIPTALAVILIRRRDFPAPLLLALFVSFILFCGFTHFIDATLFYYPIYRFGGLIKAMTAVVSLTTAVVLIRSLPKLLGMPSIHRTNVELHAALDREQRLSRELGEARDQLESRSAQLTARSRRMSSALASAKSVAVRWNAPQNEIDWEIGFGESALRAKLESREFRNWSDLLGSEEADRFRLAALEACEQERSFDYESPPIANHGLRFRLSATPEPVVAGEECYMLGMFRLIPVGGK